MHYGLRSYAVNLLDLICALTPAHDVVGSDWTLRSLLESCGTAHGPKNQGQKKRATLSDHPIGNCEKFEFLPTVWSQQSSPIWPIVSTPSDTTANPAQPSATQKVLHRSRPSADGG